MSMNRTEKQIIQSLRHLGDSVKPDPAWEQESREELLRYFKQTFSDNKTIGFNFYLYLRPAGISLLVLLFIFISGFGLLYGAKNTVPGNLLYSVKLSGEKARMALVFDKSNKTVLRAEILTNRLSEVRVLAEKVEKGDRKFESELNILAENFTNELQALKQEIVAQTSKEIEQIDPFPEQELLAIDEEQVFVQEQPSLPIQDQKQVFTVIQSDELQALLLETKELLAEKNLITALARIEQAEKIVQEQETTEEPAVIEEETPVLEPEPVIYNPQPGSVGQILQKPEDETQDFTIDTQRDPGVNTGLIRE